MSLYINNAVAEELARSLAARDGKTITQIVIEALEEKERSKTQKEASQPLNRKARFLALKRFMEEAPPLTYKDNRTLKEITDDLWE